jgi:hypothetical protein
LRVKEIQIAIKVVTRSGNNLVLSICTEIGSKKSKLKLLVEINKDVLKNWRIEKLLKVFWLLPKQNQYS